MRSALNPSRVSGWKSLSACFHACGRYCIRKTAFTNLTRKDTPLSGGCFRAQFDIPYGPFFPRTDHQYTGCHSPQGCDVLLAPANHRAASQVEALHKWQGCASTQTAWNKRVKKLKNLIGPVIGFSSC